MLDSRTPPQNELLVWPGLLAGSAVGGVYVVNTAVIFMAVSRRNTGEDRARLRGTKREANVHLELIKV